jgi:hypothetical protein
MKRLAPGEILVLMFGYKNHIGINRTHGPVRRFTVTHAAAHDGARLGQVLDNDNLGQRQSGKRRLGRRRLPLQSQSAAPRPPRPDARVPVRQVDAGPHSPRQHHPHQGALARRARLRRQKTTPSRGHLHHRLARANAKIAPPISSTTSTASPGSRDEPCPHRRRVRRPGAIARTPPKSIARGVALHARCRHPPLARLQFHQLLNTPSHAGFIGLSLDNGRPAWVTR